LFHIQPRLRRGQEDTRSINILPGFQEPRGLDNAPSKEAARAKINTKIEDDPSVRYEDATEDKMRNKQSQAVTAVILQDQINQTRAQRAALTEAEMRAVEADRGLVNRLEREDRVALAQRRNKDRISEPRRPPPV
jgi:hypothetical protein